MKVALLFSLAVVLAAAAPAASSTEHLPAENGWIIFASDRVGLPFGGFGLYRLDPVGGAVTRLGTLAGRSPAWSPDGSRIAFADPRLRIVVADADGSRPKVLTRRPVVASEPAWSPDGSRIVFQQYAVRATAGRGLTVVNVDGTGMRRLTRTRFADIQPSWAPYGSQIAFSSNRGPGRRADDNEIYVIRPDGREMRQLTRNEFVDTAPAWSPDGSRLAFVSGRGPGRFNPELWTMRSDGGGQRRVQPASGSSGFPVWSDHSPSWSPDGNWLTYVTNQTNWPDNIFIVRPDGRDKIDLTPETPSMDVDPAWQPVCSHPGTSADDRLRGNATDDRVCGFDGDDSITGGSGADGLYGGYGKDALRSVDGIIDVVGCGPGPDTVVADRGDLVGVDCERVRRRGPA